VGAAAVCSDSKGGWMALRSYIWKGQMEMFDAELLAIWIALKETAKRAERLHAQGVQRAVIFNDSQAAVRRAAHIEIGPGQQLA
jgi:hypothetical protein